MKFKISIFIFLLLLTGCVAAKPGNRYLVYDAKLDNFTHEQSGFSFPSSIGRFKRDSDSVEFYDESGINFSVNYYIANEAIATIYIYPSLREYSITPIPKFGQTPDWFLNKHYDEIKTVIINEYRARVLSEGEYKLNRSLLNPNGKRGAFEYDTVSGETVFTHLFLFAYKGWLVKYRFSYPSKYNAVIEPEMENLIHSFQWP
ncbi:MAG: hypothetical protein HY893_10510 [Deltaproteobacteria bacterium]|nr:hypothetical protein [Deltaproteobacteria bacterium]